MIFVKPYQYQLSLRRAEFLGGGRVVPRQRMWYINSRKQFGPLPEI